MGACFVEHTYPKMDKDQLLKRIEETTMEMASERSGMYPGNWTAKNGPVQFPSQTPVTAERAKEIMLNNDKWGPLFAIPVWSHDSSEKSRKLTALEKGIQHIQNQMADIRSQLGIEPYQYPLIYNNRKGQLEFNPLCELRLVSVRDRIRDVKHQFRRCNNCESMVNKNYIEWGDCPVCKNKTGFLTKREILRLERLKEKLLHKATAYRRFEREAQEEKDRMAILNRNWHWLVGGLCAE